MSPLTDADWHAVSAFAADGDKNKFSEALGVPTGGVGAWVRQFLLDAFSSRNADLVEFGLICVLAFQVEGENADTITRLIGEEWHHSHENLVSSIQNVRWSLAVPALLDAAETPHPYLAYDNETGLRLKIVHALYDIGTAEALAALRRLESHHDVEVAGVVRQLLKQR